MTDSQRTGSRQNPAPKVFIKTWGCQMNEHDSQVVEGLLREEGYEKATNEQEADLIFLNTCSVREKASHKLFSKLGGYRELKARRPGLQIAVGGCVAQQEREKIVKRAPHVDLVLGTHQFRKIKELLPTPTQSEPADAVQTQWIMGDADARFDEPVWQVEAGAHSAMITVMEGCDQVCSFCIVPFTRGREISRPADEILARVKQYAAQGIQEIMLLGQNVNAYGKKETGFPSFAELLRQVCAVPGITRVRFTSPHPQDFSTALAAAYRDLPNLAPQAHIPLQAGDDDVLHAMRRPYTRQKFEETVAMLRSHRPDIAISTDIIVGFPGETYSQFQQTLDVMRTVQFDQVFSFVYSPRPFTPARKLPDPVPAAEKAAWLQELQELQKQIQLTKHQELVGSLQEVVVYSRDERNDGWTGRTAHNRIVHFPAQDAEDLLGKTLHVRIETGLPNSLVGTREGAP